MLTFFELPDFFAVGIAWNYRGDDVLYVSH